MTTADVARDPWIPEPMRILSKVRETADTFTLRLDAKSRASVFAPGQFNMVYLFGFGEVPISISGDPHDPQSIVHTIRAVGSVTSGMKALRRGDAVGIRGPYGRGWPINEAFGKDLLLVAGGLGIAPLRSVVYTALRHRARFRSVVLLYGARSPEDLLYRREIARWSKHRGASVHVTVDHAGADWSGPVGVVPALLDRVRVDADATVAMVCGPEVMMRFTARALTQRGVRAERIFLSMERNMKCAVGFCGHCQYRESFVCKDGPVLALDRIAPLLGRREI